MTFDTSILDQARGTSAYREMIDHLINFSEERRIKGLYGRETIVAGMSQVLGCLLRHGHDERELAPIRAYIASLRSH